MSDIIRQMIFLLINVQFNHMRKKSLNINKKGSFNELLCQFHLSQIKLKIYCGRKKRKCKKGKGARGEKFLDSLLFTVK